METLEQLFCRIRACEHCAQHLPLGPRPVIRGSATSRLLIIGQAPGTKVHASGIPWDDASGARLREWLAIDKQTFYDQTQIAIMPMGLCYPGRGRSGDLPPRPECAPRWHGEVLAHMPHIKQVLLIGQYAQQYYLGDGWKGTLGETVRQWAQLPGHLLPLPHPSPRNTLWLKKNSWFEAEILPVLRQRVANLLAR